MKNYTCRDLRFDERGCSDAPSTDGPVNSKRHSRGGRFFSLGKTGVAWRVLHFLKYGLPFKLGAKRISRKSLDVKRINLLAVEHCTNACKHCSTSSPFARKRSYSATAFFPWLDLLTREGIEFKDISITGGEPFLHPDLFAFINELENRYPDKEIGLTTNFFWANENKIRIVAPKLKSLDKMLISKYPNIVAKMDGEERFGSLVDLLRDLCPHLEVAVADGSHLIEWQLHSDKREPKAYCCTSDCYILRTDGRISHCSVGIGLENRTEYLRFAQESKERLYDLSQGICGFLSWIRKYPFDLCSHCSLWRGIQVPWQAQRSEPSERENAPRNQRPRHT